MERCLDCNSLLTKDEKVCPDCGTPTDNKNTSESRNLLGSVIKLMFWLSVACLFASLFIKGGPSTTMSLLLTGALLVLTRTVDEGGVKVKKH